MNTYDKAHELAELLAQSDEYKQFKKAKELLGEDAIDIQLLQDFRRSQLEIQMAHLSGEEIDEEYLIKMEKTYELFSMNPKVNEYLNAEYRLSKLMEDIQKILGKAVKDWFFIEESNDDIN